MITFIAKDRVHTPQVEDTLPASNASRTASDCHRCGWRQELHRIGRRDRRTIGLRHGEKWICRDCLTDLLRATYLPTECGPPAELPGDLADAARSVA